MRLFILFDVVIFFLSLVSISDAEAADLIAICTTPSYYQAIEKELLSFQSALVHDNYKIKFIIANWQSAEQIKAELKKMRADGLKGCIMLGELPAAMIKKADSEPRPCALFFMDLNGSWEKEPGQDYYTKLPQIPQLFPEIWISYISADTLDGNPLDNIKNYLVRAANYHKKNIARTKKALTFIDDEWAKRGASTLGLESLYGSRITEVTI